MQAVCPYCNCTAHHTIFTQGDFTLEPYITILGEVRKDRKPIPGRAIPIMDILKESDEKFWCDACGKKSWPNPLSTWRRDC